MATASTQTTAPTTAPTQAPATAPASTSAQAGSSQLLPASAGNQAQLDALGMQRTDTDAGVTGAMIAAMLDLLPAGEATALAVVNLGYPEVRAWLGEMSMAKLAAADSSTFLEFVSMVLPEGRGYELAAEGELAEGLGMDSSSKVGVERAGDAATLTSEIGAAFILQGGIGAEAKASLGAQIGGEAELEGELGFGAKVTCGWTLPLTWVAITAGVRAAVQGFWTGDGVEGGLAPLMNGASGMLASIKPTSFVYTPELRATGEAAGSWGDPESGGTGVKAEAELKATTEGGYDAGGSFLGFSVSLNGKASAGLGFGNLGFEMLSGLSFNALIKAGVSLAGRVYLPPEASGEVTESTLAASRVVITFKRELPSVDSVAAFAQGVGITEGETLTFGSWAAFRTWMAAKDADAIRMEGGTGVGDPEVCSTDEGPLAVIPDVSLERSWLASAPHGWAAESTLEKLGGSIPSFFESNVGGSYTYSVGVQGTLRADARCVLPLLFGIGGFRAREGEAEAVAIDALRKLLAIAESGRVSGATVNGRNAGPALAMIGLGNLQAVVTREVKAEFGGSFGHGAKMSAEAKGALTSTQKVALPSRPWADVVASLAS